MAHDLFDVLKISAGYMSRRIGPNRLGLPGLSPRFNLQQLAFPTFCGFVNFDYAYDTA